MFLQQEQPNIKKIIEIEDTCYQSLPCKYYVRYEDLNDRLQRIMFNSDQIYQVCYPVEEEKLMEIIYEFYNFLPW